MKLKAFNLLILVTSIISCNQPKAVSIIQNQVDTVNNLKEVTTIHEPKGVDTLIKNGGNEYRVKIYMIKGNEIASTGEFNYNAHLKVTKNDSLLVDKIFDKNYFNIKEDGFLEKAGLFIMDYSGIDPVKGLKIFVNIGVPETDWSYPFNIWVDSVGRYTVYELDEEGGEHLKADLK